MVMRWNLRRQGVCHSARQFYNSPKPGAAAKQKPVAGGGEAGAEQEQEQELGSRSIGCHYLTTSNLRRKLCLTLKTEILLLSIDFQTSDGDLLRMKKFPLKKVLTHQIKSTCVKCIKHW
jgi:hypothetical protein